MTQSSTVASLIRLSVTSGSRRADLGLPGGVPVAELLPELARELGVLDLDSASQGFRLVRHDGVLVDADRSLAAQGVEDGFVLSLEPAGEPLELKVYDDVVEAVSDLVESQFAPWTPEHSSRSALGAAVVLFVAGAFALYTARADGALVLGLSAAVAVLLLVTATVLGQARRQPLPATALGLVAVLYAAVAGSAVTTEGTVWGEPFMYAGAGALVVGAVGAALARAHRALLVGAAVLGAMVGAIGAAVGLLDWSVGSVCAVTFAVAVIAGNLLPWFALSWTRLSGNPPRTEAEIFADTPEVDRAHVLRQVLGGHELMLATGVVVGLLALITAPRAAATGVIGTILGGVGFAAILLRTRHSRTRSAVLLSMVVGILGLATVAVSAALYHQQWRPAVGVVLAAAAAVVVALALLAPRSRVRLGRLADTLDVMCLVALLPLALAVVGLDLRRLFVSLCHHVVGWWRKPVACARPGASSRPGTYGVRPVAGASVSAVRRVSILTGAVLLAVGVAFATQQAATGATPQDVDLPTCLPVGPCDTPTDPGPDPQLPCDPVQDPDCAVVTTPPVITPPVTTTSTPPVDPPTTPPVDPPTTPPVTTPPVTTPPVDPPTTPPVDPPTTPPVTTPPVTTPPVDPSSGSTPTAPAATTSIPTGGLGRGNAGVDAGLGQGCSGLLCADASYRDRIAADQRARAARTVQQRPAVAAPQLARTGLELTSTLGLAVALLALGSGMLLTRSRVTGGHQRRH